VDVASYPLPATPAGPARLPAALRRIRRIVAVLRVLLAAGIILPFGFFGVAAWTAYRTALADAQRLVQRTVDVLQEDTLKVFETQELILDETIALAVKAQQPSDLAELHDSMKRLEQGRAQIASIWLLGPDGWVRASSEADFGRVNGSDRDYFRAQLSGGSGTYLGRAYVGRTTGRRSFGFSRRLPSADGSFQGVVAISVSSDYFGDYFHRAAPEIDHVAALIRADGEMLARDPPLQDGQTIPQDDPLMRAAAAADEGSLWRVGRDGVERLYGYRRVSGYPAIVSLAVARSAILDPWLASLAINGSITALTMLALVGLAIFALRETRREEAALLRLAAEQRQREEIEARLRQAEKLEALGHLTGTVAHDFGNLLTPILGNLHLLQAKIDDPAAPSRVESALTAAERGARLVRSLLAFARQQPLELAILDVNAVLGEMGELLKQSLGSAPTLVLALAASVWPIRADASGLEMAVLNLAINARDATKRGDSIRISTENAVLRGHPIGLAGDFVAIAVADTGSGMAPALLARAFEPFFTTKPPGKGTGLGLASVYGFAKQCGGGVTIASEVGKGTTVTIYLPRAL
jgi:signal transduction histidine kinase